MEVVDSVIGVEDGSICYIGRDVYSIDGTVTIGEPPDLSKNCLVLTLDSGVYASWSEKGYSVAWLSQYVGLRHGNSLYEIYIRFFDGYISDSGMLEMVLKGLIFSQKSLFFLEISNIFCMFTVENYKVKIIDNYVFNEPFSVYSCGTFLRRLNYEAVSKGYSICHTSFYLTNNSIWWNYIGKNCYSIDDFFEGVVNFKGINLEGIYRLLSNTVYSGSISGDSGLTADMLVRGMMDSSKSLKLRVFNGRLMSNNFFFKDYSSCKGLGFKGNRNYAIVFDCEGQSSGILNDGCRELGGIIFSYKNGIMLSEYTFITDSVMLENTLIKMIDTYKSLSGDYVLSRGIDAYVFGKSDITMLNSSIERFSKRGRRILGSVLRYVDSSSLIKKYLGDDFNKRGTLANIAGYFGVFCVKPKHNALSDARTLFNILASIRYKDYLLKGGK